MARLKQWEIDKRSGHEDTFWKNVRKQDDGKWVWTGHTNNNHNTKPEDENYFYGEFELCTRETANNARPTRAHKSTMAHRVVLFLTYGRPVPSPRQFYVYPLNGDRLDINPDNLWIRDVKTGKKVSSAEFFAVANDNFPVEIRNAA